jgi:hypothetical protein
LLDFSSDKACTDWSFAVQIERIITHSHKCHQKTVVFQVEANIMYKANDVIVRQHTLVAMLTVITDK